LPVILHSRIIFKRFFLPMTLIPTTTMTALLTITMTITTKMMTAANLPTIILPTLPS